MARQAYLYDSSKCVGCHGCQVACKQWNEEKTLKTGFVAGYQNPQMVNADTRMVLRFYEDFENDTIPQLNLLKYQCFHCGEPACVKVCPSGALFKTAAGIVAMDQDKCIACGYCHNACPFSIPAVGKHVNKCDMCRSRTENGSDSDKTSVPACVKACPAGALEFGEREVLLAKAHKRVGWLKSHGCSQANVYGENVLGGLGIISVLKYPPVKYGLPANPTMPVAVTLWKDVFGKLDLLMLVGAFGMTAVHRFLARRQEGIHRSDADASKGGEDIKP